jgi:hypothetical protein
MDGVVRHLPALLPHVGRLAGAAWPRARAHITAYWATNLRDPVAAGGATFRFVERPQTWLTDQLGRRPAVWATVFGLLVAAGAGGSPAAASRQRAPACPA